MCIRDRDNDDLRNYLVDMLRTGYNIQSCPNGKEALIIIREFNPDLVISDIMMPEMGGDELCASIKGDLEMSHIPVVIIISWSVFPISSVSVFRRLWTCLLYTSHKEGLDEIITKLHEEGVEFLSTGGTRQFIESLGYPCKAVERCV